MQDTGFLFFFKKHELPRCLNFCVFLMLRIGPLLNCSRNCFNSTILIEPWYIEAHLYRIVTDTLTSEFYLHVFKCKRTVLNVQIYTFDYLLLCLHVKTVYMILK